MSKRLKTMADAASTQPTEAAPAATATPVLDLSALQSADVDAPHLLAILQEIREAVGPSTEPFDLGMQPSTAEK